MYFLVPILKRCSPDFLTLVLCHHYIHANDISFFYAGGEYICKSYRAVTPPPCHCRKSKHVRTFAVLLGQDQLNQLCTRIQLKYSHDMKKNFRRPSRDIGDNFSSWTLYLNFLLTSFLPCFNPFSFYLSWFFKKFTYFISLFFKLSLHSQRTINLFAGGEFYKHIRNSAQFGKCVCTFNIVQCTSLKSDS
jgi:hypothetical protein